MLEAAWMFFCHLLRAVAAAAKRVPARISLVVLLNCWPVLHTKSLLFLTLSARGSNFFLVGHLALLAGCRIIGYQPIGCQASLIDLQAGVSRVGKKHEQPRVLH